MPQPKPAGATGTAARRRKRLTREAKRQANRERILHAARKVFGNRGYHAATIEEIADESGLSNGAVYYNFKNKEDLFFALLEEREDERIAHFRHTFAAVPASSEADLGIAEEARDAIRTLKESREWRLLLMEFVVYAARNPRFRKRFVAGRRRFKAELAAAVEERLAAAGVEPRLPPEKLAVIVTALVHGLSVDELTEPGSVPDDLLEDAVATLLASRCRGREPGRDPITE